MGKTIILAGAKRGQVDDMFIPLQSQKHWMYFCCHRGAAWGTKVLKRAKRARTTSTENRSEWTMGKIYWTGQETVLLSWTCTLLSGHHWYSCRWCTHTWIECKDTSNYCQWTVFTFWLTLERKWTYHCFDERWRDSCDDFRSVMCVWPWSVEALSQNNISSNKMNVVYEWLFIQLYHLEM